MIYIIFIWRLPNTVTIKLSTLKKILIVDDDPDILELVKYILEKDGFEVHTHSTGIGVPDKVGKYNPDVILLDIQLPGKSGTEIYKDLRKSHTTPVIFFSANADKKKILEECNAKGFISKPFDVSHLVSTIIEYAKCA